MPDEDRVEEILAEWQIAKDRGVAARPETVIRKHPEHAAGLREAFSLLGALDQVFSAESPGEDPPPERIGPYRVRERLGTGGMGTVYRAVVETRAAGLDEGTVVALKLVHAHLLQRPGFFKRFLREAEIGRSVEHPNVVRTFDADALVQDGRHLHFLVMEYVQGQTLGGLLRELERVPEELCRHIAGEVAKGLAAIHEAGVVHRDLKPENVLITPDHQVKVMDLGVAHLQAEAVRLSQTGAFVGSLEYAAPEQFQTSDGEPDGRADLHSLGVVLYELATGAHPFRDEDASKVLHNILEVVPRKAGEVNPQLSPFFEEMVHTLLGKDREERFAAASDLVRVLGEDEDSEWWKERARALRVETKRPLRRIRIPRETALYGRDDDLAWMRKAYRQAKAGDGRVLLIEGEAGIGKTRLVDEFVGQLRQEGEDLNFLFGSYPPGGAATVSGAFSEAYREQFGAEGLEEVLGDYLAITPILVPSFAALLKGDALPEDAEPLTKDSLHTVFVHATRGLAKERTTIVLIDDLHFAPEDGRALFTSLAMAVPEHRVLLVGTMRPGVPDEWTAGITRLDQGEQQSLARLGPKDLTNLLTDAFRSERLAEELAYRIAQKSDGNPFFSFEIIRGLKEGQFLAQRPDGTWVTTQVIEDIQVPSSVLDLVNARVGGLTAGERDVLELAACCGFEFDPSIVCEAASIPRLEGLKLLGQVERTSQLVRALGRRFAFDHHQVQEALYGSLSEMLRAEYHGIIARTLEARLEESPAEADGVLCVDLCEHFLKAGLGSRAIHYLTPALDHFTAEALPAEAVALADRVLGHDDLLDGRERVKLLLRTVDWLTTTDALEESERRRSAIWALLGEVDDDGLRGQTYLLAGRAAAIRDDLEEALRLHRKAREYARRSGDTAREARALAAEAGVLSRIPRLTEARARGEEALTLCEEVEAPISAYVAHGNLALIYNALGEFSRGERHARIAVEIGKGGAAFDFRGDVYLNLVSPLVAQGRLAEAEAAVAEGVTWAQRLGARGIEAQLLTARAEVAAISGRPEQALAHLDVSLRLSQDLGRTREIGHVHAGRADALSRLGRVAEALDAEGKAHEIALSGDYRLEGAISGLNLARKYVGFGALDRAEALAREAVDTLTNLEMPRELSYALHVLGGIELERGSPDHACALHARALEIRHDLAYAPGLLASAELLGDALLECGRKDEARTLLKESVASAEASGQSASAWTGRCLLLRLGVGREEAAQPPSQDEGAEALRDSAFLQGYANLWKATGDNCHLEAAYRALHRLHSAAPEEYRESMLRNVRLNREIIEAWAEHGGGEPEEASDTA